VSTQKPTLSRQSSRIEMDAHSEESSTEASNTNTAAKDSSSGTEHPERKKQPALQQGQRPRAGTSLAATASGGAPSTSTAAASNQKNSTEPALSPRGALPPLPTTPGSTTPSSSKPGSSKAGSPASNAATPKTAEADTKIKEPYVKTKVSGAKVPEAIASSLRAGFKGCERVTDPNNPAKVRSVPIFNVPIKQIARLLVGLESNFYNNKPSNENMQKPLRDGCGLINFEVSYGNTLDEINVIDRILLPFTRNSLGNPHAEQARVELRERFNEFASGPHKNLLTTEEGKNAKELTLQNLSFREQFDYVIQPLQSYIYGPDRNLESSCLPEEFKIFLKEIVHCYFKWSEQQDIPPDQLFGMVKSAVVGMLFIRGLSPLWIANFDADAQTQQHADRAWVTFKQKLSAQLGRYTSFLCDDFVLNIIASTAGKPKAFEDYFRPLEKAAELRRKEALAATAKQEATKRKLARSATISGPAPTSTGKLPSLGNLIQGLVSPRKKEKSGATQMPMSPRSGTAAERVQSSEGLLLKKTDTRANQVKRTRVRGLDQYLKEIKVPDRDPGFIRFLNNAIGNRANYEIFEIVPAAFCLQQLNKYLDSLRQTTGAPSQSLEQTQTFFAKLARDERKQAERDVAQSKRQVGSNSSVGKATNSLTAKSPLVPSLDLGELKNSPFAEEADDEEEASASSKTEPSDSSEVETERSEDDVAILNQVATTEKEKN